MDGRPENRQQTTKQSDKEHNGVVSEKPASPLERAAPGINLEAAGTLCILRYIA
jgi:hypothetical protein